MSSKPVTMWRLCDWYIHERKFPMTLEQLFEIYRATTKSKAIPDRDDALGNTRIAEIASMFRHVYGNIFKKREDTDWKLRWVWEGHMKEFPHLFSKGEIKGDT